MGLTGALGYLKRKGLQFLGSWFGRTPAREEMERERIRAYLAGLGGKVWILPYLDNLTGETAEMRAAYRQMLKDPTVKAALYSKIFGVASLDHQVHPGDEGERNKIGADFVDHCVRRQRNGMRGFVEAILPGMLIDGFAIAEKVRTLEQKGKWAGKMVIASFKSKDPETLQLEGDEFKNITGLIGRQYNAGEWFDPANFVICQHMQIFESPTGMSDLRAAYRCYDRDTEVLTRHGWKLFSELTDADEVAALNNANGEGELVYQKPTDRHASHYQGKMFRQNSRNIDLCVTPNHRMWIASGSSETFKFVEASELMDGDRGKVVRYKRDAKWQGEERETFSLPGITFSQRQSNQFGTYGVRETVLPDMSLPMDDWLRFLGLWLAEGHTYREKGGNRQCAVGITQNEGETLSGIIEVVQRLGFTYCIKSNAAKPAKTLEISSLQLWTYLEKLGKSHTKYIPREYMELSSRQLGILLEWMLKGDGRHEGTQYASVSKRLADGVAELALKVGLASNVYEEENECNGQRRSIWIVGLNRAGISRSVVNHMKDDRSWEDYDGTVYCVTVPAGIIYVRRNGKACWCGNSYWMIDTAWKLRAMHLEKYTSPMMIGKYTNPGAQKSQLEASLANMKATNWLSVPIDVQVEAVELSQRGTSDFQSAILDLRHEIMLGITGAILQALEGANTGARSIGEVHQSTADLLLWYLSAAVCDCWNTQVTPDLIDLNYVGIEYPRLTLGGIDDKDLKASMDIDVALLTQLRKPISKKYLSETYGRPEPLDDDDALHPPPAGISVPDMGLGFGGLGRFDEQDGTAAAPPVGDLKSRIGASSALMALQKSYYAGEIARLAAMANAATVFGLPPQEVERLFPEIKPTKLTPDEGGGGQPGAPPGPPAAPAFAAVQQLADAKGASARPFRASETSWGYRFTSDE